eukprot:6173122-Pleurochrysis_carterae.AAC.1
MSEHEKKAAQERGVFTQPRQEYRSYHEYYGYHKYAERAVRAIARQAEASHVHTHSRCRSVHTEYKQPQAASTIIKHFARLSEEPTRLVHSIYRERILPLP